METKFNINKKKGLFKVLPILSLLLLLLLVVLPVAYALNVESDFTKAISGFSNNVVSFSNVNNNINNNGNFIVLNSSLPLVSWSCDSDSVPTSVKIGECYCVDTTIALGILNSNGIGYGNLINCLKLTDNITVSTGSGERNLKLAIKVIQKNETKIPYNVLISKVSTNSSTLKCTNEGTSKIKIYSFYRVYPLNILYSGFKDEMTIPSFLSSGDEIKCSVSLYDGWTPVGSDSSSNSIIVENNKVVITDAYVAPAYPKKNETVFCYGSSSYDYPLDSFARNSFNFYVNGVLAKSDYYDDAVTLGNSFKANLSLSSVPGIKKTDVISCDYSVEIINASNSVVLNSKVNSAKPVTVVNTKPVLGIINIGFI